MYLTLAERHQWDNAPPEGAQFVTATDYFELYEIEPVSFGSDLSTLGLASDAHLPPPQDNVESATLDLKFRNTSSQAFRLPNPQLLTAELCWIPVSGGDSDCFEERLLRPLALGPQQTLVLPQVVKAPETNDSHELTIRTISPEWRDQTSPVPGPLEAESVFALTVRTGIESEATLRDQAWLQIGAGL